MEIISLIYTNKINPRLIGNFLENNCGFCHYKRSRGRDILENSMEGISIIISKFKIEIMYKNDKRNKIACLVEKLSIFNNKHKVSLKIYKVEEKDNIKHSLKMQDYYLI